MAKSAIRSIRLPGLFALFLCAACGVDNGEEPAERSATHSMTIIVYLNQEVEASRTWKNEGKGSPSEVRLEFAQDGSIDYWWDSKEPMPLMEGETETLFWAIAMSDEPQMTTHLFIGDSPASRLSHLLAQASKVSIRTDRSLIITNQFQSCGPSGF